MNFPIKASDLRDIELSDDEQATLIVIEAIENGTLNDLEFSTINDTKQVLNDLQNWEKYNEYKSLIGNQKAQLKATFFQSVVDKEIGSSSQDLAQKALIEHLKNKKQNSRIKYLSMVSSAALICFLFIGIQSILLSSDQESNFTVSKTTDEQQVQSSPSSQPNQISQPQSDAAQGNKESILNSADADKPISTNSLEQSSSVPSVKSKPDSKANNSSSEGIFDNLSITAMVGLSISLLILITSLVLLIMSVFKRRKSR